MDNVSADDTPQRNNLETVGPVSQTNIRTTVVALDIAQLVVSILVVVGYFVVLIQRGTVPETLNIMLGTVVGAIVAKKLPS